MKAYTTYLAATLCLAGTVISAFSTSAQPDCQFNLGFKTAHDAAPERIGTCISTEGHRANGDGIQYTTNGYLLWNKETNTVTFTPKSNGNPYGSAEDLHTSAPNEDVCKRGTDTSTCHLLIQPTPYPINVGPIVVVTPGAQ